MKNKKQGGARKNAGRPKKPENEKKHTKVIRVPVSTLEKIYNLINNENEKQ
ncbi:hypothetical protein KGQ29_03880 [Patescibacteria group bacterium]|nr:hypothetical protein [Patescibacteria group bacterium]